MAKNNNNNKHNYNNDNNDDNNNKIDNRTIKNTLKTDSNENIL